MCIMVELGDIKKVAKLAKITLSEEEAEKFSRELTQVFQWVEQLSCIDFQSGNILSSVKCPVVEDIPGDIPSAAVLLKNAPESRAECFVVPNVLGECKE